MESEPPFEETYKTLFDSHSVKELSKPQLITDVWAAEERELPLIDLRMLSEGDAAEIEECKREITKASEEWGFFQVVNHGVSGDVLEGMRREQVKVFREPFYKKKDCRIMNMSPGSYRWGTPSATSLWQLSWSEAFHIPLTDIPRFGSRTSLRLTMKKFATSIAELGLKLASILAESLGEESRFLEESCSQSTCYLRMNRYPPCPKYRRVFGLMPHTDSDFLTILCQDQVGGLQLVKDGKWISVQPNPKALIVNIGDLFQAWSNGVYRSVEHRVVANGKIERFSTAYFLCPSHDAIIQSCKQPSLYRRFSFREYRQQVQDDVKESGHKIGLSRFLICRD
ncbi:hypothetical protein Nepgr_007178 [Nepenthes gracilis]|uniref:gibberellin 2beta-dioxygenase n=1 Tax=Nepenthes gracilis TaxID=150966 RepID=A0AAD3XI20_NEPGR|nr:hypothetical protein Nepgr_007178 [Nepenthes gracilis]